MAASPTHIYQFGPCRLDARERVLLRDGRPIALTPKVFDTLLFFVENPARLIEKEELMEKLWPGTFVEEGNLTFNISVLRKALGEWENGDNYIKTVPKRGYRFVAPVRVVGAVREPPLPVPTPVQTERAVREPPSRVTEQDLHVTGWRSTNRFGFVLGGVLLAIGLAYWLARPLPVPVLSPVTRQLTHDSLEKQGPLLTDGPRLYFQEKRGDRWVLASVPAAGGEPSVVPVPLPGLWASDISADGAQFLGYEVAENEDRIVTWPLTGGPPEYIGELHGDFPARSPDGARIAYVDEMGRLAVAGRDGKILKQTQVAAGSCGQPRWSSDGSELRFSVSDPKAETDVVWEVSADGGSPREIASGPDLGSPRLVTAGWIANSAYSMFRSFDFAAPDPDVRPTGSAPDIWIRRENCGFFRWACHKLLPLATGGGTYVAPLPSHDGKSIFAIGSGSVQHLERYDQTSGAFTPYLGAAPVAEVDFSRDGERVAYVRDPDHTLWRSEADGSDPQPLTSSALGEAHRPHWSPDGSQIAFMATLPGQRYKAYVVPANGGVPQTLVEGNSEEGVPTWSRDGKSLVWGDPLYRRPPSEMKIHKFDVSTHQVTELPDSAGLLTARWSPDGRYVVAVTPDIVAYAIGAVFPGKQVPRLWFMALQQKYERWTPLVSMTDIQEVVWARDSQYIYFNTAGSDHVIYRVRVAGGHVDRLLNLQALSSSSDWAGVTPDGSLLIVQDFPVQEVYALDLEWR